MAEPEVKRTPTFGRYQRHAFGFGSLVQWFINSAFNTWVFTFYFSAVKLDVGLIMIAYILWSIYNALNDPLIGWMSDRTHTRWGRRKPYIMLGTIPVIIIEIILWTPPLGDQIAGFVYLLIMLYAYDTFYTMIALPYDALFPELYTSVEDRAHVNTIKQIYATIGMIAAFLIPGIFIDNIEVVDGYRINGIFTAIFVAVFLLISIKWGVKERPEFKLDYKSNPSFFQSVKYAIKNKSFVLYTVIFLLYEYVLLVLSTVIPLYSKHILGTTSTIETAILLGLLFIIGLVTVPIWKKSDVRLGSRKSYAIAILAYLIPSISLIFVANYMAALFAVIIMGFGFGGMLYFAYLIIADVIDEDELKTGVRREGAFFGVTNFFMRLAGVLSIMTISLVFQSTGWEEYTPLPTVPVQEGLKVLIFVFPAIALGLSLLCLYFYPFTKNKVLEMKAALEKMHADKFKRSLENNP